LKKPYFPKKAIVTNGMPYGNKPLHFGHVGGLFIHSDIYARFLRVRIGKENVIYVSGADCYGSGTEVKFNEAKDGGYSGTIEDFVADFHREQKAVLDSYNVSLNLYAASALPPAAEIHHKLSEEFFEEWHENGFLKLDEGEQFFDVEKNSVLNGRQVEGRCPIVGCRSEVAYADECSLGHQYSPHELIAPKSVISGTVPVLKPIKNWYFDLECFEGALKDRQVLQREEGISRKFLLSNIDDFLKKPAILISNQHDFEKLRTVCEQMPKHEAEFNEGKKSATLVFNNLKDREISCKLLRGAEIRFRTGTTLTPFRLTGNVNWGIPAPKREGVNDQTFWCWPESLWAPISFVQTYLELEDRADDWRDWWFNEESRVYQFIGEDNIYFYSVAGIGLFMAINEIEQRDMQTNLPIIIPNRHVFFGNSKASSSGELKPPQAAELLEHYTVEQLRMHFAHMALHGNSSSFFPKAVIKKYLQDGVSLPESMAKNLDSFDATLAEGNILTNVYNRLVRSCFYTVQKYYDGKLPQIPITPAILEQAMAIIDNYEWAMYRFEFAKVIDLMDVYLRNANKTWSANIKDESRIAQTLVDAFHEVRTAATLLHPFAPDGTERIRHYLNIDERLWDWNFIDKPIDFFITPEHDFVFLEPKVDFFHKHPSQLT